MTPRGCNYTRSGHFYPLTCRLCDKTFLNNQAILNHYRAHVEELVPRTLNPSLAMTQSLPFFDNGNPMMQQQQHGHITNALISNATSFFGSSSSSASQQLSTITNLVSNSRAMSSFSASPFLRNKRKLELPPQPSQAKRFRGLDESSQNTRWYLGQLERCTPWIINLDEEYKDEDLDLKLKL